MVKNQYFQLINQLVHSLTQMAASQEFVYWPLSPFYSKSLMQGQKLHSLAEWCHFCGTIII